MPGVGDVVARLEALDAELSPADGVKWFNKLYLEVTRHVAGFDESGGQAAPGFLARLDVAFADSYFAALAAAGDGPELPPDFPYHAWRPLFEARRRVDVAPIQFALAGVNAHINHDLGMGICAVCVERGVEPAGDSAEHRDYLSVNDLIAATEAEVKVWLLTDLLAELDRAFNSVDDIVAIWSVERARDAAWTHAGVLWHLRDTPFLRDEYLDVNDRSVELTSRAMLVPVGLAVSPP